MKKPLIDCSKLREALSLFPTPFYLYDEAAIRRNARKFLAAFAAAPRFIEFFAVKANPNPRLLDILRQEGFGADCSSLPELLLAQAAGITGENIVYSSNNTSLEEFRAAIAAGTLLNLDDVTHIEYLVEHGMKIPEFISFRYNPGNALSGGNEIIGKPAESKYGCTREQIIAAVGKCRSLGASRFGLHTMVASNEMNTNWFAATARMMFELAAEIYNKYGIRTELVNIGGGIGIPYQPEQQPVDIEKLAAGIMAEYNLLITGSPLHPLTLAMECGRVILGPYGWLVTKVIHDKKTYKNYIGVDACMADLMRPGMYGAYHHISVPEKENEAATCKYDVVGSLCENNDKFAIDRELPLLEPGDVIMIHDAGAHGHAMGFNYNGRLRPAEYLLCENGEIELIRRAETVRDYFATLEYPGL